MPEEQEEIEVEYYDDDEDEFEDADIDAALQALDAAQSDDEERLFLEADKMPCPECAGGGAVQGGILGNHCPRCGGQRVVAIPGTQPQPMFNWKQLRAPWQEYAKVKGMRKLPASYSCGRCGGTGKGEKQYVEPSMKLETAEGGDPYRTSPVAVEAIDGGWVKVPCTECGGTGSQAREVMALPPASSLPKKDFLAGLQKRVQGVMKQLDAGTMPELAPAPEPRDDTSLGGYSDAELDDIEERSKDSNEN